MYILVAKKYECHRVLGEDDKRISMLKDLEGGWL